MRAATGGRASSEPELRRAGILAAALAAAALLTAAAPATLLPAAAVSTATLPGLQTGKAPWSPGWTGLAGRLSAIGLPALTAEGTVVHIHQHLDLYVAGRKVGVPAYVGFGVGADDRAHFLATIHTHDPSGVIHVESPTRQAFTLGELFDVWGVRLTPSCLGGYCAKGRSRLWTFSNGRPVSGDPRRVVLKAHEEIVVAYGTKAQLPHPLPARFAFPKGF